MALDDKQKERLAELQKQRAESEQAETDRALERELAAEELAVKLAPALGKRGEDFAIISNRYGVFGLRKPDAQAIRNWERAEEKQKLSLEWQIGILRHYIEPKDTALPWAQTCAQRPGVCWQTAEAFVELMGVDRETVARK